MFPNKVAGDKFKNTSNRDEVPKSDGEKVSSNSSSVEDLTNSSETQMSKLDEVIKFTSVFSISQKYNTSFDEVSKDYNNLIKIENYAYICTVAQTLPCSPNYYTVSSYTDQVLKSAYDIYTKAINSTKGFVLLGNIKMEYDMSGVIPVPIPSKESIKYGVISDIIDEVGCVLSVVKWNLFVNDMFVLGSIDGRLNAHLITKREEYYMTAKQNDYCKVIKTKFGDYVRLSYFARELIGFLISGYRIQGFLSNMEFLSPPMKYIKLSLLSYVKAIEYFEKSGNWRHLCNPNLVGFDFDLCKNKIKKVVVK